MLYTIESNNCVHFLLIRKCSVHSRTKNSWLQEEHNRFYLMVYCCCIIWRGYWYWCGINSLIILKWLKYVKMPCIVLVSYTESYDVKYRNISDVKSHWLKCHHLFDVIMAMWVFFALTSFSFVVPWRFSVIYRNWIISFEK